MIDDYFENLEKTILDFKHIINSYTIFKKEEKWDRPIYFPFDVEN